MICNFLSIQILELIVNVLITDVSTCKQVTSDVHVTFKLYALYIHPCVERYAILVNQSHKCYKKLRFFISIFELA